MSRDYSLRTGRIHLPGLDIIIHLNRKQFFRDDGIVDDFVEHTERINRSAGIKSSPSLFKKLGTLSYMSYVLSYNNGEIVSIIYRKKSKDRRRSVYYQAAVETEALLDLSATRFLDADLIDHGYPPYASTLDPEIVPQIGGVLALQKRNLDIDFQKHMRRFYTHGYEALKPFDLPERCFFGWTNVESFFDEDPQRTRERNLSISEDQLLE